MLFRLFLMTLAVWQPLVAKVLLDKFTGDFNGKGHFDMTLQYEENKVKGVYFYHKYMKDIKLSGVVKEGGDSLELKEYDSEGKEVAVFKIKRKKHNEEGDDQTLNDRALDFSASQIEAWWSRVGSKKRQKVSMEFFGSCSGNLGDLYGSGKDDEIHAQMKTFWDALREKDKSKVASCIHFPIQVSSHGKKLTVKTPKELLDIYSAVFHDEFLSAVLSCPPRNLWKNYQGIMFAGGLIWFDYDGKVLTLNN